MQQLLIILPTCKKHLNDNDYERFNELLADGADINRAKQIWPNNYRHTLRTKSDNSALFFATILLVRPENLNLSELLLTAIKNINQEAVKLLIAQDVDVNYQDANGDTPLHHCAIYAFNAQPNTPDLQNIVQALLYAGADLKAENNKRETIAHLVNSKKYGRYYMIENAINAFEQEKNKFYTAQKEQKNVPELTDLLWAIHTNNSKQLSDLINDADRYYIGLAFKNAKEQQVRNTKLIRLLEEKLKEFNQQDDNKYNATISHLDNDQQEERALKEIFTLALKADDLSCLTNADLTELNQLKSLFCAAAKENKITAALELLNRDICPIWETNRGEGNDKRDALEIAYDLGHKDLLTTLLNHEKTTPGTLHAVFIKAVCSNGNNNSNNSLSDLVLTTICKKSSTELVKLLDLILQKETEDTFAAAITQLKNCYEPMHPNHFTALLNTQYDAQHDCGKTLLISACKLAKEHAVEVLLQQSVDHKIADRNDKTALDYASENKTICDMLTKTQTQKTSAAAATKKEDAGNKSSSDEDSNYSNNNAPQSNVKSKKKNNNTQQSYYNETIIPAINAGKDINKLLSSKFNANYKGKDDNSLLIHALEAKNNKALITLIKHKADILNTYRKKDGANPLMVACEQQNLENIRSLIVTYSKLDSKKVKDIIIDKKDNSNQSLITYAHQTKNSEIIYLIDNFIKDNSNQSQDNNQFLVNKTQQNTINKSKNTPQIKNDADNMLLDAAYQGNLSKLQNAIDKNADINAQTTEGFTALMYASHRGYLELVQLLLRKGANVNAQYNDGSTALMLAFQSGHLEITKLLIENGANVNAHKKDGWTPLMYASNTPHLEVVQLLLNKGANVNAQYDNGSTALMLATQSGHLEVVKLLLSKGANVNAQYDNDLTALLLASQTDHLEIIKLLIAAGANVNAHKKDGSTALIHVSDKGYLEVVKLLIERGANVNAQYDNGSTALILAAQSGHLETVRLLLSKGANVNAQDKNAILLLCVHQVVVI